MTISGSSHLDNTFLLPPASIMPPSHNSFSITTTEKIKTTVTTKTSSPTYRLTCQHMIFRVKMLLHQPRWIHHCQRHPPPHNNRHFVADTIVFRQRAWRPFWKQFKKVPWPLQKQPKLSWKQLLNLPIMSRMMLLRKHLIWCAIKAVS